MLQHHPWMMRLGFSHVRCWPYDGEILMIPSVILGWYSENAWKTHLKHKVPFTFVRRAIRRGYIDLIWIFNYDRVHLRPGQSNESRFDHAGSRIRRENWRLCLLRPPLGADKSGMFHVNTLYWKQTAQKLFINIISFSLLFFYIALALLNLVCLYLFRLPANNYQRGSGSKSLLSLVCSPKFGIEFLG